MVDNLSLNLFPKNFPHRETVMVSDVHPEVNKKLKQYKKEKLILPLSLLTGGGILLYYGIKAPTKSRIIKNIVNDRISQMNFNLKVYSQSVDETIGASYKKIADYIENFVNENKVVLSDSLFTNLSKPKKILNALDLAFDVVNSAGKGKIKGGLAGMGKFSSEINQVNRGVSDILNRKKELMRLLFEDYIKLSQNPNTDLNKLLISSSASLREHSNTVLGQMEVDKFIKQRKTTAQYYKQMAQAITNSRDKHLNTKRHIVDTAFAKISELLELGDDFVPSYSKLPGLEAYNKLTPDELKPQKASKELKRLYDEKFFFKQIVSRDFNKLSDKDLNEIFYSMSCENNLEDLKLLIDRFRLRQIVSGEKAKELHIIIPKLEYLANKLHDFGIKEIVKRASKDFSKMNSEQKRAALYYVSLASRRVGFNTIEDTDKYMTAKSPDYAKLNIHYYMELFKNKPELYYF